MTADPELGPGSGSDPGPAFDLPAFRAFVSSGDGLDTWVQSALAWLRDAGQNSPPPGFVVPTEPTPGLPVPPEPVPPEPVPPVTEPVLPVPPVPVEPVPGLPGPEPVLPEPVPPELLQGYFRNSPVAGLDYISCNAQNL